tara:strand:+ start:339 stop:449 length:111 start_codon:yes stop_codon:yes gene_type:complete
MSLKFLAPIIVEQIIFIIRGKRRKQAENFPLIEVKI